MLPHKRRSANNKKVADGQEIQPQSYCEINAAIPFSLCFLLSYVPPPPPIDLSTGRSMLQGVEPLREMKVPPLAHGLDRVLFK